MNNNEQLLSPEKQLALRRLEEIESGVAMLIPFDIQAAAEEQEQLANNYLMTQEIAPKDLAHNASSGVASIAVESEAADLDAARRAVVDSQPAKFSVAQSALREFGDAN